MKKVIGSFEITDNDGILVEVTDKEVIVSNSNTYEVLMYLDLVEVNPMISLLSQAFLELTK